jgi:hypothetical protein
LCVVQKECRKQNSVFAKKVDYLKEITSCTDYITKAAKTSFGDSELGGTAGFYPIQFVWNDDKSRVKKIILHMQQDDAIFQLKPFEQFEQLDEIIVLECRCTELLGRTSLLWRKMCSHLSVSEESVDCAIKGRYVKLTRLSTSNLGQFPELEKQNTASWRRSVVAKMRLLATAPRHQPVRENYRTMLQQVQQLTAKNKGKTVAKKTEQT